jgi:hypothetical protein
MPSIGQTWVFGFICAVVEIGVLSCIETTAYGVLLYSYAMKPSSTWQCGLVENSATYVQTPNPEMLTVNPQRIVYGLFS